MRLFQSIAVFMTLSASFGYLNHRFTKLPTTIVIFPSTFCTALSSASHLPTYLIVVFGILKNVRRPEKP
jgi:hypothetical protein